jgi:hypothetical protein
MLFLMAAVLATGLAAFFYARSRRLSTRLTAAYAENTQLRRSLAGAEAKKTTEITPGRYPFYSPPSSWPVSPSPLVRLAFYAPQSNVPEGYNPTTGERGLGRGGLPPGVLPAGVVD